MAKDKKSALLAGATGLVGNQLLQLLLQNYTYHTIWVPGRRAPEVKDDRVKFIACDFSDFSAFPKEGTTEVFCTLGTTIKKAGSQEKFRAVDFEAVVNLARWAAQTGTAHFVVVSSIGAQPKARNFYLRTKGQMEQVLKTCGLQNLSIVRPALLLGTRSEFRLGEKLGEWLMQPLRFLLVGPLKKYRPIKAARVARAMLHLAQNRIGDTFIVENQDLLTTGK